MTSRRYMQQKLNVVAMCLKHLWSRLRTGRTNKAVQYSQSLLWGKWVLVSTTNYEAYDKLLCEHEQCAPNKRWTEDDRMLMTVTFANESNEWVFIFESHLGVVENRFVVNEEVSTLTPNRYRINAIFKLVDLHSMFSFNVTKNGQQWTSVQTVDPKRRNTLTNTITLVNGTHTILTYKRLASERSDV